MPINLSEPRPRLSAWKESGLTTNHTGTKASDRSQPPISHEFHAFDKTLLDQDQDDGDLLKLREEEDSDDMFFKWDEEDTLLSDLMEEGPVLSDEDRLYALAESLQAPFEVKGKQLKKEMAETFVPAVRQVKAIHRILNDRVDVMFGKGLSIFNGACKDLETETLAEFDTINEAYHRIQNNVKTLISQLRDEHAHRDKLWMDLENKINAIVDPALLEIKDTPGRVERSIAKLEKHCQSMEKGNKGAVPLTEKEIKEFISKLG